MAEVRQHIEDLLEQIDTTPYGPAERALIDEAIGLADGAGEEDLAYAARLRLLPSAARTGDTDAQLSAFAWCIGRNAADPDRFPAQLEDLDLLWFHKHIVTALMGSPLFPLADVDAAIEAMQEQYGREGVGLSGVWQARFQAAVSQGLLERAAGLLGTVKRTPRDEYSHCETCARAEEAEFRYLTGDDAAGLVLVDEILDEDMTCGDEPENTIAHALLPLLRAGRLDEARQLHLRGYRMARANPDNLRMIAQHLRFCAVTGNEARGLEILEQHFAWLAHDGLNDRSHLEALSAAGLLLAAADRAGAGDQVVAVASDPRLARFLGEHPRPWSVRDLATAVGVSAADLAGRFDARNGNDFHTRRLADGAALLETRYDVPLTTRPAARVTAGPPPDNAAELRTRAATLLEEAGDLAGVDPDQALTTADEALRLALLLGDRELAVDAARLAALNATAVGEDDTAVEYWRTAVSEAAAGELPSELDSRLQLGAVLSRTDQADEGTVEIQEVIRRLTATGAPAGVLAEAHFQLGQALATDDQDAAARDSLRDAVALASAGEDWETTTRYALALGELLAGLEDPEALNVLAGAVDSARNLTDDPLALIHTMHEFGRVLSMSDQDERAERVLREALALASVPPASDDPAVVYEHADILDSLSRTIAGAGSGRLDEAVILAQNSATAFLAVQSPPEAGRALLLAAGLLDDENRSADALPLLEQAAELLDDQPELLMQCLDTLAAVNGRLGRAVQAREANQRAELLRQELYASFGTSDLSFLNNLDRLD